MTLDYDDGMDRPLEPKPIGYKPPEIWDAMQRPIEDKPLEIKENAKRIIVKIGTSTLTDSTGHVDALYITSVAAQVAELHKQDKEVVIVSSGAISAGLEALGMSPKRPNDMPLLQASAAVGQVQLVKQYADAFEAYGIKVAQVLLTRDNITNRDAFLHARDTLNRLLELGIVPIINENDTVAIEEIRFGDNDNLAAQVGIMLTADIVILLSDIDGLYTADPRIHEDARLIHHIGGFTEEIIFVAGLEGSTRGSGGMVTKIEAARQLMASGIPMIICEGRRENVIVDVVSGNDIGTRFEGEKSSQQVSARKLWKALSGKPQGSVMIDDGAAHALRERGGSLLPVGITRVNGEFLKGSIIDIRITSGFLIGRGIAYRDAADMKVMLGYTSEKLIAMGLIAAEDRHEFVHRDEMVIF